MILLKTPIKIITAAVLLFCTSARAEKDTALASLIYGDLAPPELHGFYETRAGYKTRKDKYQKDMSIMENRLQLDIFTYNDWADFKVKADVFGDLAEEKADFQMREANFFARPLDFMDIKVGRQILTWGTGDLLFINDLFPKDWQSFFIGRDSEYLKAPSDAAKISLFSDFANLDFVYTPQFDHDTFISGRRLSYHNSNLARLAGKNAIIHTNKPDSWFRDDEFALRLYKNINNYELALYGYTGFWKSPGGFDTSRSQAIFPDLNVYGSSIRGPFAKGIANIELGYYQSEDDPDGTNPNVKNSEFRYLVGYTQEIGKNFTAALQYYVEQMLDYSDYKRNIIVGPARNRDRHLTTLRLTKLLMNQNLTLSLFTYFSPTDKDVYMRPNVHYKATDHLAIEFGANVFFGDYNHTFFGQFQNNTNIYTAVRYTF